MSHCRFSFIRAGLLPFVLFALGTGCGDDSQSGGQGGGQGGTPSGGNNTGADGAGAAGGQSDGGGGSAPFSCEQCVDPNGICVDDTSCAGSCPAERDACHTDPDPNAPEICCATGEQCCTAVANGYPTDLCASADGGCPILCPDGTTTCDTGEYCELDAEAGTYACATECNPVYICGDLCCPLGSTCSEDNSTCVLPDLTIDEARITESIDFQQFNFQDGSCSFFEGCIEAIGQRQLMRFDLTTPNIGDGDLFLGDPTDNPLFLYSPCHDHFHFEGYARYRLLDANGAEVAAGHKQAFCLLDWEPYEPGAPQQPKYDCGYQGIQKGWADTYESSLPCQWVDITDVPPGNYMLEVVLNGDHTLGELDYTNNSALVPIIIE